MASLSILLEPKPAARPRVTRWGTYFPKPYAEWKAQAARLLAPGALPQDKRSRYVVVTTSISTRAKTSKLVTPNYDSDNTAKAALDVVTKVGGYWPDDKQIELLISGKRFAGKNEDARTIIDIYQLTTQ